ncbi:MAG: ABC transporter transmembrane domain-containing protein, partial [Halanaerobiaceae bacterium]
MSEFREEDYSREFDPGLWKKLIKYMKPHKRRILTLMVVMVGVAAIDAILPYMNKYAINNFILEETTSGLGGFAAVYGLLAVVQAINIWIFISLAGRLETGLGYDIRDDGFKKLQELSFSYYDKKAVGWLMARMTSDIRKLGQIISWGIVDSVWGIPMMGFMMIMMFINNYKLALITIAVLPFMMVISFYFQKKILKASRRVRKINSKITGSFNEGISGAKTTKTLVREEKNLEEFSRLTGDMKKSSIRAAILSSLYLPIVLTVASIGTAMALTMGGRAVYLRVIDYGTLVLFLSYTIHFFEPIFQ